MSLDPSKLVAISYPKAVELCRQLNGATISDDLLCRGGWPGPVAVALGNLMHAGGWHHHSRSVAPVRLCKLGCHIGGRSNCHCGRTLMSSVRESVRLAASRADREAARNDLETVARIRAANWADLANTLAGIRQRHAGSE